jgi:hypothetical protein
MREVLSSIFEISHKIRTFLNATHNLINFEGIPSFSLTKVSDPFAWRNLDPPRPPILEMGSIS